MPVVAVIGAVAIDAFAIEAGAALLSFTTLAAVGATVGAIGAVTHNKTLSIIGGVMGLVGGIGALATASGAASGSALFDAGAEGEAADAATAAAGGMVEDQTAGFLAGNAASEGSAGLINSVAGAGAAAMNSLPPMSQADFFAGTMPTAPAAPAVTPDAAMASGLVDAKGPLPAVDTGAATVPTGTEATADPLTPGTPAVAQPSGLTDANAYGYSNPPGMFDKLGAWAGKHDMLAYGLIQAGAGFISGLTNPLSPAQIDALNAQAEQNRAAATLMQRQADNMGGAQPVANFATVTGAPIKSGNGLINQSSVRTPLITGTPNTGAAPRPAVTGALV